MLGLLGLFLGALKTQTVSGTLIWIALFVAVGFGITLALQAVMKILGFVFGRYDSADTRIGSRSLWRKIGMYAGGVLGAYIEYQAQDAWIITALGSAAIGALLAFCVWFPVFPSGQRLQSSLAFSQS